VHRPTAAKLLVEARRRRLCRPIVLRGLGPAWNRASVINRWRKDSGGFSAYRRNKGLARVAVLNFEEILGATRAPRYTQNPSTVVDAC
jgi:hypothetical protein